MKNNKQNVTKRRQTKRKTTRQKRTTQKYRKKNKRNNKHLRKSKKHTKKGGMFSENGTFNSFTPNSVPNTLSRIKKPYAIVVITTHGSLLTMPQEGPDGFTQEFNVFSLPVNMYKIDVTAPGSCYTQPSNSYNRNIETLIRGHAERFKDYYNRSPNSDYDEPYDKLKEILPDHLKELDKRVSELNPGVREDKGTVYPFEGNAYEKGSVIYDKLFGFNSEEAQIPSAFAIELYLSDIYGNLKYYDITEEVFERRNFTHTRTPSSFMISFSDLLTKIHNKVVTEALNTLIEQGEILPGNVTNPIIDKIAEAYNYIFIDSTCATLVDQNRHRTDERDTRRLLYEINKYK